MKRWGVSLAVLGFVLVAIASTIARHQLDASGERRALPTRIVGNADQIRAAISGLDLERAKDLLRSYPLAQGDAAALRARLALYQGDCDESRAILGPAASQQATSGLDIASVAEGCARAMAAARVVSDDAQAVWIRLQDDADAPWLPLVIETAVRARASVAARLGARAHLPLRIELVMDHASLSALTGLPLEAAETTGTVAVARFGRVTLLSPRAFQKGYPWQDTLAHEITHLLATAASNDNAPLWLQEGLAKHLETSWRPPRPHDGLPDLHEIARSAWLRGQSVGFERLGASIALLPNPAAANIAYAEVFDFLNLLIRECGWSSVSLILRELRVLGSEGADAALRSVTGYSLEDWTKRWRYGLAREQSNGASPSAARQNDAGQEQYADVARRLRLAELFVSLGLYEPVQEMLPAKVIDKYPFAELRSPVGVALLMQGAADEALRALGEASQLENIQGEWLALRGRSLMTRGQQAAAHDHFTWALAYAPTDERVACQGFLPSRADEGGETNDPLCLAARKLDKSAK
jgi:tetratricopeptide (TPR) repeat protein